MIRDRIEDGERIAQLLASELDGLETGPLEGLSVVDADRSVTPGPEGPVAYGLATDRRIGRVRLYPDRVLVELSVDPDGVPASVAELSSVSVVEGVSIAVEDAVAVKRAVDAVRELLARE